MIQKQAHRVCDNADTGYWVWDTEHGIYRVYPAYLVP